MMLTNPLHRFSPYHALPSNTLLSNGHMPQGHLHTAGLDTLAQGSHYAMQQLQQHVGVHNPHLARAGPQMKHRQHPYGPAGRVASAAGPIRRRISRACDQCNQLRTKCDGQHPCAHCIEFGLGCEYIRERKKRGKASRKDLAQQAAAQAAAAAGQNGQKSPSQNGDAGESKSVVGGNNGVKSMSDGHPSPDRDLDAADAIQRSQRTGSIDSLDDMDQSHLAGHHPGALGRELDSPGPLDLNGYGSVHNTYDRQGMGAHMMGGPTHGGYSTQGTMSSYPDLPYSLQTQSPTSYSGGASYRIGTSPLSAYPGMGGETTSPGWMSMSSPPPQPQPQPTHQHQQQQYQQPPHMSQAQQQQQHQQQQQQQQSQAGYGYSQHLRYPVLEPLVPHLGNIIPLSLACDLVDLYFASSSSAQMHPMSPYVLGFVFRKRSFLHPSKPRPCQPALLASILWVAAQTSDAPFLTGVPSARGKICQKLLELTVSLLKPLIHTPSGDVSPVSSPVIDGVALGGLGVAMPGSISMEALSSETGAFGAAGTLDDVVTYIHLATVVSASEYKGASLRWWNAAWSLARELKLGRELPQNAPSMHPRSDLDADADDDELAGAVPGSITEEEREERRRIWWLVYIVDRHLALCYNRPLFLLDIECDGLMQPMDDTDYQNGEFHLGGGLSSSSYAAATDPSIIVLADGTGTGAAGGAGQQPHQQPGQRMRGPVFECTGHSIFGYFLPLMTILGEIVDLHHARNHPRFGVSFRSHREWDDQTSEITRHLEMYERSLKRFEQRHLSSMAHASGHVSAHSHAAAVAVDAAKAAAANAAATTAANAGGVVASSSSAVAVAAAAAAAAGGADDGSSVVGDAINAGPHDVVVTSPSALSVHSVHTASSSRMTESDVQTRIVLAYGTHVMHVLHILLTGKWDPINLLDDNDLWISSQGFITATGHAVDAAEAISSILEFDPGLEFMPFFFGIYLLQGSFLLLLIADKLQSEASPSVVKACETIIRAHEACVVTLNTEYQRNFSKVMRSALAQVRGRVPEDLGEQHQRRRELLALYRWTGDGTGLAL